MTRTRYAIALGSNRRHIRYGSPDRVIVAAIDIVAELGSVGAISRLFRTPALGPAGRSFANAAIVLESELAPDILLKKLKQIERNFGRRKGQPWGPRVLDLDIILWSGGAWSDRTLTVPHVQFRTRRFVLAPLAEVAPTWHDPLTRRTVRQLLHLVDRRRPRA